MLQRLYATTVPMPFSDLYEVVWQAVSPQTATLNVEGPRSELQGPSTYCPVRAMAEDTRFELVRGCPQHAFQACALGH